MPTLFKPGLREDVKALDRCAPPMRSQAERCNCRYRDRCHRHRHPPEPSPRSGRESGAAGTSSRLPCAAPPLNAQIIRRQLFRDDLSETYEPAANEEERHVATPIDVPRSFIGAMVMPSPFLE